MYTIQSSENGKPYYITSLHWSNDLKDLAYAHTGKCICRFGGIYAYCRYFIDRKW